MNYFNQYNRALVSLSIHIQKQGLLLQSLHIVINMSPTWKGAVSLSLGRGSALTKAGIKLKKREQKRGTGGEADGSFLQQLPPGEGVMDIDPPLNFGWRLDQFPQGSVVGLKVNFHHLLPKALHQLLHPVPSRFLWPFLSLESSL